MPPTQQKSDKKAKEGAVREKGAKRAPGERLAAAFEAVERFPVLAESQARVMKSASAETTRTSELVEAIESDVALTIAVLRAANREGTPPGGSASVVDAVEVLKPTGVLVIAGTAGVFDFFESNGSRDMHPEQFRVHALATQHAADAVGRAVGWPDRDELAVASLLHDIGRLVIHSLHPGNQPFFNATAHNPEQRLREERDQLGIDHALVGGVLARRWNLPQRLAVAIERHHAPDAEGLAAVVSVADMIAHYSHGEAISPERLHIAAERCALDRKSMRQLLYELSYPRLPTSRVSEPCPLSARELDVLRRLSEGMVYKQIAGEMRLSVSTIRTHLHNVYGKIGAVDRAQAVLTARDRGWI